MAITSKRSLSIFAKCTSARQLDDKMIVSTSDDVLSSRNHKHLITTIMQIQNCSFLRVCHAVQVGNDRVVICSTDTDVLVPCWCRAVGCYGYRNAVVLYPSPRSVFQSRPGSKQGITIFYTIPGCDTTFCFSERINKWLASKPINSETFLPTTSTLSQRYTKDVPEHSLSNSQHSVVLL